MVRKKEITDLLRKLDKADAQRLSEQHLTLSEQERTRILHKIEARLTQPGDVPADIPEASPVLTRTSRLRPLSHAVMAAACAAVFCIPLSGVVWLKTHAPQDCTQTSVPDSGITADTAHAVGETYAVPNMTGSGTLYVTVTDAVREETFCRVDLLLESAGAVSYAADTMGEPSLFFADNFRLASGDTVVSPCRMQSVTAGELLYTFTLQSGKTCALSLWYPVGDAQADWKFIASASPDTPYTIIHLEEST